MITSELKSQLVKIWTDFWKGGIANPLTLIKQFTYLLFIPRLDEIQLTMKNRPTWQAFHHYDRKSTLVRHG